MNRSPRFFILLSIGVLLVAVTFSTMTAQSTDQRMQTTSFSTSPFGLKAIYATLETSGMDVRRWRRPYAQIPEKSVLIIAGPEEWITQKTWRQTLQPWVSRGGTLILATGAGVAFPTSWYGDMQIGAELEYRGTGGAWQAEESTDEREGEAAEPVDAVDVFELYAESLEGMNLVRAVSDTPITPADSVLTVDPGHNLTCDYGMAVPLFADKEDTYAWFLPVHQGRIILTATPGWLMNLRIAEPGNVEFLLAIINAYGANGPILFDERAHKYGVGDRTASDLWETPAWGAALAQMMMLTLWYGMSHARRFGPRRQLVHDAPRSTMEYVDAMGNLYRRADMQLEALNAEWHRFRVDVAHRYGIDPQERPVRLVQRLAASTPASSFAVETAVRSVGEALRREKLDDKTLVRASRALVDLRNEVL